MIRKTPPSPIFFTNGYNWVEAAIVVLILLFVADNVRARTNTGSADVFVGSNNCAECHSNEFQQWQKSHHSKSMMLPDEKSVLGDFESSTVNFNGIETVFTRQGDDFFITTQNASRQIETYKVMYTFGYVPLQQYLLDIGDGKLQAFDVAWDSRSVADGGQRWLKLRENEDTRADNPFHWTRQSQNWNSQCAECHSTDVSKGYDPKAHSYQTSFSDINVGCESCHGAGKRHVELVKSGAQKNSTGIGFKTNLEETRTFLINIGKNIASGSGEYSSTQINACGGCHSRRQVIGKIDPAIDYHDQYRLRFLDEGLYHADGQIQDEVFVLGSFLQSKMHKAGVTCTNCHNAHTGVVKAKDNSLCTQCHLTERYDDTIHHHHDKMSQGAQCINCHMPATIYMEVDDRRDHSFSIPQPKQSTQLATPNACIRCHVTQNNRWASSTLEKWLAVQQDRYGVITDKGRRGDSSSLREMISEIENRQNAEIKRATLMTLAANIPSRATGETLLKHLKSESPLMRRAAAEASQFMPQQQRWTILKGLIGDPTASVRFEVARQLVGYAPNLQGADHAALKFLLEEYFKKLLLSQDTPAGQAQIADYKMSQKDIAGAISALKEAVEIEPGFVPALVNLADLYRAINDKAQARKTLEKAMAVAPGSAAVQHSYGLYWVRQGNPRNALQYLKAATETEDSNVRYYYVYAVAQESQGQIKSAIETLKQANQSWPNQYDILLTLIVYLEKSGNEEESWRYLPSLSAIAPDNPGVKRRMERLQNKSEN